MEITLILKTTKGNKTPLNKYFNESIRAFLYNKIREENFKLSCELHGKPSVFIFNFFTKNYPVVSNEHNPILTIRTLNTELIDIFSKINSFSLDNTHEFKVISKFINRIELNPDNIYILYSPIIIKDRNGKLLDPLGEDYNKAVEKSIKRRYNSDVMFNVLNLPEPYTKSMGNNIGHKYMLKLEGERDALLKCLCSGIGAKNSYGFGFIKSV